MWNTPRSYCFMNILSQLSFLAIRYVYQKEHKVTSVFRTEICSVLHSQLDLHWLVHWTGAKYLSTVSLAIPYNICCCTGVCVCVCVERGRGGTGDGGNIVPRFDKNRLNKFDFCMIPRSKIWLAAWGLIIQLKNFISVIRLRNRSECFRTDVYAPTEENNKKEKRKRIHEWAYKVVYWILIPF